MSVPRRYVQKWAPWSMTPPRKASAWTRLPISRPCMSVIATIRVSMRPSRTSAWSSWSRGWSAPAAFACEPCSACMTVIVVDLFHGATGSADGVLPPVLRSLGPRALGLDDVPGRRLELALELGQLRFGALDLGALKVPARPAEVVDE